MELIQQEHRQEKIFTIRSFQVMLDKALASFYGVKPIGLREQVKRNPNRFPDDFVFVLTEQAVAAVSGVIKNEKADEVSVAIARAFVAMRNFLFNNTSVFQRLDQVELKQHKTDEKLEQIFEAFSLLKNNYSHLTYPLR